MSDNNNIFNLYMENAATEEPTMYSTDTMTWWKLHGKLHRTDGPAMIRSDGSKRWYMNDKLHRINGPAVELHDGTKMWYVNDDLHREDGPAVMYGDGYRAWFLHNRAYADADDWAAAVLKLHNKPDDAESVERFLFNLNKKQVNALL